MRLRKYTQLRNFSSACLVTTMIVAAGSPGHSIAGDRHNDGRLAVCHLDKNNDYQLVYVDTERALDHLEYHQTNSDQPTRSLNSVDISERAITFGVPLESPNLRTVAIGDMVASNGLCPAKYKIGDTGPNGGIVFHVSDEGYVGLEVAPLGAVPRPFGCLNQFLNTSESMFKGWKNTNTIVDEHDAAAAECAAYTAAKYTQDFFYLNPNETGWHLPSMSELISLYDAWVSSSVPGLEILPPLAYWSSTDVNATQAFAYDFGAGGFGNGNKNSSLIAIPVHAFKFAPQSIHSLKKDFEALGN